MQYGNRYNIGMRKGNAVHFDSENAYQFFSHRVGFQYPSPFCVKFQIFFESGCFTEVLVPISVYLPSGPLGSL